MGNALNITIESFPPMRGRKRILVDGVPYGIIHMTQHGCYGTKYNFHQAGNEGAIRKNGRVIVVTGDKMEKRLLPRSVLGVAVVPPLSERLLTTARSLIEDGLLVSEEAAKATVRRRNEEMSRLIQEREWRELEALRAEAIKRLEHFNGSGSEKLIDAVVELMKWAQTQ